MNVLVTGGFGFIGSHIVDALLKEHTVIVCDDMQAGVKLCPLDHPRLTIHQKNIRNLTPADVKNVEAVVHAAARADISANWQHRGQRERIFRENVIATHDLLECLDPNVCRQFVMLSTCAVYDDCDAFGGIGGTESGVPVVTSPYAASKLAGEAYLQSSAYAFDWRWHVLRLGVVMGDRLHHGHAADFVRMAAESGQITAKSSGAPKSAVHVADVVDSVRLALTAVLMPSGVYNVSGGVWSWRDTYAEMCSIAGCSVPLTAPQNIKGWTGDPMAIVTAEKIERYRGGKWRSLRNAARESLIGLGWGQ